MALLGIGATIGLLISFAATWCNKNLAAILLIIPIDVPEYACRHISMYIHEWYGRYEFTFVWRVPIGSAPKCDMLIGMQIPIVSIRK